MTKLIKGYKYDKNNVIHLHLKYQLNFQGLLRIDNLVQLMK